VFVVCHFAASLLIGGVCFLQYSGTALSDAYHPDPAWIKALLALLWVLQTPATVVHSVALRHSRHGANWQVLGMLGILWSLFLGYG